MPKPPAGPWMERGPAGGFGTVQRHGLAERPSGSIGAGFASGLTRASSPGGVGVGGGQHAEQDRAAAGPRRGTTTADAGDGTRPLETKRHRCGFLRIRHVHLTEAPKRSLRAGDRRGLALPIHCTEKGPVVPPARSRLRCAGYRADRGDPPPRGPSIELARWSGDRGLGPPAHPGNSRHSGCVSPTHRPGPAPRITPVHRKG